MKPGAIGVLSVGSTIRSVALETGISAMTLRDWERRFGFPAPERRPGSDRRLYAAADVARLKLVKGALARGYRIGDVVTKTNDELTTIGGANGRSRLRLAASVAEHVGRLDSLVALLAGERIQELENEIRLAAATYSPRQFVTEFAHPLLVAVGIAWANAKISVRHEHLVSEYLMTSLRQIYAVLQPSGTRPVVLLGTFPGDVYSLPLLSVALFMASLGARTHIIGSQTPVRELADAAIAMRVDVVGVSISPETEVSSAKRDLKRLRTMLPKSVSVWVGGGGAAALELDAKVARTVTTWPDIEEQTLALQCQRAS